MIQLYPQKQNEEKHRIAILDDDKNIVDSLKEIIVNNEYLVDAFYDIESLEESLRNNPYCLIFWIGSLGQNRFQHN